LPKRVSEAHTNASIEALSSTLSSKLKTKAKAADDSDEYEPPDMHAIDDSDSDDILEVPPPRVKGKGRATGQTPSSAVFSSRSTGDNDDDEPRVYVVANKATRHAAPGVEYVPSPEDATDTVKKKKRCVTFFILEAINMVSN
jgi:hypothetical protein